MREIAWHVAQLRSNCASTAIANLRNQDFPSYDPHSITRTRRSGVIRHQLFQNYLFVGNVSGRERSINGTKGILSLLGPIRNSEIDKLRAMENVHGNIVLPKAPVVKFSRGDKVRLKQYDITTALYIGQTKFDRSIILLSILGDRREVEVKDADLIAA